MQASAVANKDTSSGEASSGPKPASMPQPNAPHISNYDAAPNMNPSQAFTLTWDLVRHANLRGSLAKPTVWQ